MSIQMVSYCKGLSVKMEDSMNRLANLLDLGRLPQGYKTLFETTRYQLPVEATVEDVENVLDDMFGEVKMFEQSICEMWPATATI